MILSLHHTRHCLQYLTRQLPVKQPMPLHFCRFTSNQTVAITPTYWETWHKLLKILLQSVYCLLCGDKKIIFSSDRYTVSCFYEKFKFAVKIVTYFWENGVNILYILRVLLACLPYRQHEINFNLVWKGNDFTSVFVYIYIIYFDILLFMHISCKVSLLSYLLCYVNKYTIYVSKLTHSSHEYFLYLFIISFITSYS